MDIARKLKDNPGDSDARGPVIKAALALAHALVIARGVDADVGGHAHVQPVLVAAHALPDRRLRHLQLRRRDASVPVHHPQSICTPGHRRPAYRPACCYPWPPFARLALFAELRHQPVLLARRAREWPAGRERRGEEMGCCEGVSRSAGIWSAVGSIRLRGCAFKERASN